MNPRSWSTMTYSAQGSPDTALTFDLIGANVNDIHRKRN